MAASLPGACARALSLVLILAGMAPVRGADAAAPAAAAKPAEPTASVVELSPFEVRAENDVGYQAANTTSGSRLNSRLRDTPAAVSAFTPEFLADIAATNLEEMLGHATNIEIDVEDANAGFNNPSGRGADGNDYQFRMRGSPAGASRDFVDSSVPVDLYNVERAEVASGPNSILFGLGQAGGLVSLSGKKAGLNRDRTTLKSMWGSWHYERYEGDYNKVLIPKKLSLRLLGLYQNSQGWRYWDFTDQARWTTAVAYQPFKNTTVNVSYEKGHMDNNLTIGWNATDQITGWQDGGGRVFDGTAALPGTARFSATNNRFTFNQQDGVVYNLRGEFQSSGRLGVETLLPSTVSPYDYNITGPGGVRHQSFDSFQIQVQQRLPRQVVLELAYFKNKNDVEANGMAVGGTNLRADPNLTLPRPDGATGTVNNAFGGRQYFEALWFKDWIKTENEVYRLSAAWDVGRSNRWYGRHRIAALLENSQQDRLRRWRDEILVDENNVPITNAASAEGAQNQVIRRNYLTPGDFRTYYASDSSVPIAPFTFNGKVYTSTYASRARANTQTVKEIDTLMFASQSFWFKERLVTTLGARRDDITFRNAQEARVLDPNDPRVRSKLLAAGEWYFDGTYVKHHYTPTTFTAGAVLHATKRLSLFYNMSKNNGQPRFDRTVLPNGDVPEPTEGRGRDFGVMLDLLGEDKLFVRTTWFETKQLNDSPILPGSNALGVDNLTTMLTSLLSAGKISQADYDRQAITWTSATIDIFTEGLEVEVVANPTKNLTLRASYSNSKRRRENFFTEVFEFFGSRVPQWRQLLANNPTELATFNTAVQELESELAFQVDRQNSPFGTRPHKMNGTARYRFSEGPLRGVFVGGSIRYNGKNFLSQNLATGRVYWGNESVLGDAFAGYRTRVPRTKLPVTLQLNVKNISDSYRANIGRYNDDYTGVRRVYLNEPRSYRFTTTLEF
ncbi:TonB-dependent receptor plug domain-containing protein [Horticoccus sp. 23ND18S-11]|uniref:TonB-dependent receptor plug domain-containing protein n=1 Tax=Horticoccus sp. 23ND18S-11 TaxID=3391832 RepID=UPI0039C98B75